MKPVEEYAALMPIDEYFAGVRGMIPGEDGSGYYATATEVSDIGIAQWFKPKDLDPKFTHVAWYNK